MSDRYPGLVESLKQQQQEVDRRLLKALADAGRSPLGMPASVDTFKAWLSEAGLCLVPLEGQKNV